MQTYRDFYFKFMINFNIIFQVDIALLYSYFDKLISEPLILSVSST